MKLLNLQHCTVDLERGKAMRGDEVVALTTREVQLLNYLSERPCVLVPRDELYEAVWGYTPVVYSRALDTAVCRLRIKVEADPSNPDHVLTVHGEGYQYVPLPDADMPLASDVIVTGEPSDHPPLQQPTDLPRYSTSLVGRVQVIESLADMLSDSGGLVTILGPGGMGKSRVAVAVAGRLKERDRSSVWYCSLSDVEESSDLIDGLARQLGICLKPSSYEPTPSDKLGSRLASEGSMVLVLDDFDGLVESAAPLISAWLSAAPELRIVITSRARLNLASEQVVELGRLSSKEGAALFGERARALRGDLVQDDQSKEIIDTLVERLDCMPLAIELAAARMRVMSPEQLLIRLSGSYSVLQTRARDVHARHQGLYTMLASAWEELDQSQRVVLACSTVFRGGFSLEAIEGVVRDVQPELHTLDVVEDLADKSWLRIDETIALGSSVRLDVYVTMRTFIVCQSEIAGLVPQFEAAHAAWYLEQAERRVNTLIGRRDRHVMVWLTAEMDNIWAIAKRGAEANQVARARALWVMFKFSNVGEMYVRINALLDETRSNCPEVEPNMMSRYLEARAQAARRIGRLEEGLSDAHRAVEFARTGGDRLAEGDACFRLAGHLYQMGELDASEAQLKDLCRIEQETDSDRWALPLIELQVVVEQMRGTTEATRQRAQEGLRLACELDMPVHKANMHKALASVERALGDFEASLDHCEKCIALYQSLRDPVKQIWAQNELGMLLALQGENERAIGVLDAALSTADTVQYLEGSCIVTGNLGGIYLQRGELAVALSCVRTSIALFEQTGICRGLGAYLGYLGAILALRGELDESVEVFAQARLRMSETGWGWTDSYLEALEAHRWIGQANVADAREDTNESKRFRGMVIKLMDGWQDKDPGAHETPVRWARVLLRAAMERSG